MTGARVRCTRAELGADGLVQGHADFWALPEATAAAVARGPKGEPRSSLRVRNLTHTAAGPDATATFGVESGEHYVITCTNGTLHSVEALVRARDDMTEATLTVYPLNALGTLELRASDRAGNPVRVKRVDLLHALSHAVVRERLEPDENGRIEGLVPGDYVLRIVVGESDRVISERPLAAIRPGAPQRVTVTVDM